MTGRSTRRNVPVRVGLLGCSDIARRKMLPAILASDHAVLAAAASRTPKPTGFSESGASCLMCSYQELIEDPAIDLIYLSLPNHLHEEWSMRALDAGKDVICEKPLGLSLAAVERMLTLAENRGRLLCENLMFLHHPQHAVVKSMIESDAIGRLIALRSVFGFPLPQPDNFRLDPARGGGAFWDLARYPLGIALYFLRGQLHDFHGVALDREGIDIALQGGALSSANELFSFHIAFGQQYEAYYELVGEFGKIRIERPYTTPADMANRIVVTRGQQISEQVIPPADHFRLLLDHVCTTARGDRDFRQMHEQARQIAVLADRMKKGCRHDT